MVRTFAQKPTQKHPSSHPAHANHRKPAAMPNGLGPRRYRRETSGPKPDVDRSAGSGHLFGQVPMNPPGGRVPGPLGPRSRSAPGGIERALIGALGPTDGTARSTAGGRGAPSPCVGGVPVPADRRSPLEIRLGYALGPVRIHPNSRGAADLNARAYTSGRHIFVSPRHTPINDALLAHEMAHVIQQAEGRTHGLSGRGGSDARPGLRAALETEARAVGHGRGNARSMTETAGVLRELPAPPPPGVMQFDLEEDIQGELHRLASPEREGLSEAERRDRAARIADRRGRLRVLFRGMSPADAARFRSRLTTRVRGDALSERFHDMLATETRAELLAILEESAGREPRGDPEPTDTPRPETRRSDTRSPTREALDLIPDALRWIRRAQAALRVTSPDVAEQTIRGRTRHSRAPARPHRAGEIEREERSRDTRLETEALETHFHVALADAPAHTPQIVAAFGAIAAIVRRGESIFRDHPASGQGAGAAAFLPMDRDGFIYFTPLFFDLHNTDERIAVVIHEAAHYLRFEVIDYARPTSPTYGRLVFDQAMDNAYSYSQYAVHINLGGNVIFSDID